MTREERPLLSRNNDDSSIDERNDTEDDALLGSQRKEVKKSKWAFWREFAAFTWAFVATVAVIVLAVLYQHQTNSRTQPSDSLDRVKPAGKRNLIFMVSDGMGPASLAMTRNFRQFTTGLPIDDILVLDRHLIGQSRTRSSNSLVTDSAAGATAFSCGKKSYNGAISMLPDHTPCGTVLEAAKRAGYTTGMVVTTRITDATPACFGSHVNGRGEENSIARQLIGEHPLGHVVDLMLGGGSCHFLPQTEDKSCRGDNVDVIGTAKEKGYKYLSTREDFDRLEGGEGVNLPLLGLFSPTDIPYEIDRRNMSDKYPSLDEMARTALNILKDATTDSEQGFFLMIEGSRIDHAGHGNDPVAQVHEVLAYDKAFSTVLDFLDKDSTDGVLVATSDHETGGLAVARQLHESYPPYVWYPSVLANASHSSEYLAHELRDYQTRTASDRKQLEKFIRSQVRDGLGVTDISDAEISSLYAARGDAQGLAFIFADIVSRRAQTGWSTHGHSAVDVSIYSSDPKLAAPIVGNHENTEIGNFLADFLDLDIEPITKELKDKAKDFRFDDTLPKGSWLGDDLILNESGEDAFLINDHYDGSFKKRQTLGMGCDCGMH